MTGLVQMKNKKFGFLIVMSLEGTNKHHEAMWKCMCRCWNVVVVRGSDLRRGHTKSCGCWDSEAQEKRWQIYRKVNGTKINPRYEKRIYKM